jgi:formate hydrogenlyase transcriptional activator
MDSTNLGADRLLARLAEGAAAPVGEDFFRAFVRHAAETLGVAGAWATEYLPDRRMLRPIAFWHGGRYVSGYEYVIDGTPCEPVIANACLVHYADRLIELFPDDPDLDGLSAVSYAGIPFVDERGEVLGHLAALDTKRFELTADLEAAFRVFAARASAELIRLRAEAELRAEHERFAGLFEGAMDGILELDAELRIRQANPAAARAFGATTEALTGRRFAEYLMEASAAKVRALAADLDAAGPSRVWVAGGLEARRGAAVFPAEASLAAYSWRGEPRYCVILRDIAEQVAAEDRLRRLEGDTLRLRDELDELRNPGEIAGRSPAIRAVVDSVRQVAPTPSTVLVTGETGTGKELIARAIHRASRRAERPFVRVNCAAIPESLGESEFFGHEKGAFTGAVARRVGRFELADGGTIFLDEVGELSPDLQAKLLRVLQEGEFEPVGSSRTRKVDVRVVAATNRDLRVEVEAGRFREDLYYRLNVFPIRSPALRERGDDVELLAELFVERYCRRIGRRPPGLTPECRRRLRAYPWPGNVRELENVVERAVILCRDDRLALREALPQGADAPPPIPSGGRQALRDVERATLLRALEEAGWKVAGASGAARALDMPPSTLTSRMKALGLRRPR